MFNRSPLLAALITDAYQGYCNGVFSRAEFRKIIANLQFEFDVDADFMQCAILYLYMTEQAQ
jgi:hypothetical protein